MNSKQKLINIITICRKAGKLVIGFDAVKEAVLKGNVSCIIVTEDISPKTFKEIRFFADKCSVDTAKLELDSYDMQNAVGKKAAAAAVCDSGFASKILETAGNERTDTTKKQSGSDGSRSE